MALKLSKKILKMSSQEVVLGVLFVIYFVFVHDDIKRGLRIDTSQLAKKFKIIRNNNDNFIFDYGLILENAKELHLIESSFRQLCETLMLKSKKLFLYKDDRTDYSMSLFNKKTNKWVGTSKKWKEIRMQKYTDLFQKGVALLGGAERPDPVRR